MKNVWVLLSIKIPSASGCQWQADPIETLERKFQNTTHEWVSRPSTASAWTRSDRSCSIEPARQCIDRGCWGLVVTPLAVKLTIWVLFLLISLIVVFLCYFCTYLNNLLWLQIWVPYERWISFKLFSCKEQKRKALSRYADWHVLFHLMFLIY